MNEKAQRLQRLGWSRGGNGKRRLVAGAAQRIAQPIGNFQGIQFHLARMAVELEAARLLVYRAVAAMDRRGEANSTWSSMAKLHATEAAQRIIDAAVQIHGGEGVLVGSVVERLYREIRALRIYEGTSEIQHLVIATRLQKEGRIDAFFSAGSTGAVVAVSLLGLGRLERVDRPAIATIFPSMIRHR